MGIQGLLQFVKPAHEEGVCVSEYKNRPVGVDISTWIFRGEVVVVAVVCVCVCVCACVQLNRRCERVKTRV